jgi:hypothetical protein
MDLNKHLQNSKKIKKILGSGPSCWKWRGICMPPCICFGACFNFLLVVWGRYIEGIHWVYGKKTMWSILENGMSTLVSIWLSKMLCWLLCCVSLLSNTLGKSLKGLYIYGMWTRNAFPLYSCAIVTTSVYINHPHVLCTHLCSQQAPYLLIYATYPLT